MWGLVEKKWHMRLLATFDMNIIVANAPMNINQHDWWVTVNCNHLLTCPVVFSCFNDPKCSCWTIYPTTQCLENKNTITVYLYHTKCFRGSMLRDGLYLWCNPLHPSSDSSHWRGLQIISDLPLLRKVLLYVRESPSRLNTFILIYIYVIHISIYHIVVKLNSQLQTAPHGEFWCPVSGHPCWKLKMWTQTTWSLAI
jgi:hypothetical protein